MSGTVRVLVVDDDRAVRKVLQVNLGKQGMLVTLAENPDEALAALREAPYDIVLTDVKMPGATGIELLGEIRRAWPDLPVVVMTGYGSVTDAVTAMKAGAADYVIKPISKDELMVVIERALERSSLRAELRLLRQEIDARYGFENLIGATPVMVQLYEEVASVADTTATVLLQGPTGTGKELLAHAIHYRSGRASGPFVRVNCAAIPESLLESELFGHEKGAFTGAIRQHRGKFEQADGGTLLLDEIGEVSAYTQVKLLRVLENGEFQRVGGSSTLKVDVRVIAATNKDLALEAREKRFREDLYYRLNVMALHVPALRERRDDIPLLADHFLASYAAKNNRPVPRIGRKLMERLVAYDWPGNVRQLEHLIERAVILSRGGEIEDLRLPDEPEDAEPGPGSLLPPVGTTLQDWLLAFERDVIVAALKEAGGVQARAARRLGLSRSNLNYRIGRLGIEVKDVDYG
ncbi:MAG: sigma-54 dependent transcriptional regulator [Myxococcota bacterium]